MPDTITICRLAGADLRHHLPELARLRIEVFRAFPYLYEGSTDYEERYLATYAATPGAVIVGALDGERLVGAATGLPMAGEPPHVRDPVAAAGYAIDKVFYFGESVLEAGYRGQGIGVAFFSEREAHARALGGFQWAMFCGVVRPADHPLRPADFVPLDRFWDKRGYRRLDGLRCSMSWRDVGEAAETAKPMQFWGKRL